MPLVSCQGFQVTWKVHTIYFLTFVKGRWEFGDGAWRVCFAVAALDTEGPGPLS